MHHEFWHKRWATNDIGFHEESGNHLLKKYFSEFPLPDNALVFVPLCGKTKDISWLLKNGCKVVAIELNEQAVQQLFAELGAMPQIEKTDVFTRYYISNLSVYVGDFFALEQKQIGVPDLVFDRGALVALPDDLRNKYTEHLHKLTPTTPKFVICYQYDQSLFKGPPFSVTDTMVREFYEQDYAIDNIFTGHVEGGFREQSEVFEAVYRLSPR
ncbi:thiopurine S-methyltransferase [Glaciecola sp. SC05]|uniref:thiopurine S-methyltransferase n=1 Tax=Glaciecola sp. SC05 TaxID=1987355 RepID=UPI003527A840